VGTEINLASCARKDDREADLLFPASGDPCDYFTGLVCCSLMEFDLKHFARRSHHLKLLYIFGKVVEKRLMRVLYFFWNEQAVQAEPVVVTETKQKERR